MTQKISVSTQESSVSSQYVKDLLEVQKNAIIYFFKEVMTDFNTRLDRVAADVQDLKCSQTFQGDELKEKTDNFNVEINKIKKDLNNVVQIQGKIYDSSDVLTKKCIELEGRSRRNNIRISGVKENEKESWDDCKEKVNNVLENNLNVKDVKIERAHGVGKKRSDKPRTIVCKLLSHSDKERVLAKLGKLKGTNIYINEDFSEETMQIRQELFKQRNLFRDNGKFAKFVYNKLVVREFNQRDDFFFFFYLFRCPTSYERAQNTRLHR